MLLLAVLLKRLENGTDLKNWGSESYADDGELPHFYQGKLFNFNPQESFEIEKESNMYLL